MRGHKDRNGLLGCWLSSIWMNHGKTSVVFRLLFYWSFRCRELGSALFRIHTKYEHHSTATYYKNVQLLFMSKKR